MWKKLPGSRNYFISYLLGNSLGDLDKIYVTDFLTIWCQCFGNNEFATCLKESNKLLEIETSVLVTKAKDMLQNVETITKVHASLEANNALVLEIVRMEGFPLKLNISLKEEPKEQFFRLVTQPLLRTVDDLRSSENKLCQLLLRKDKEIKEYKEEGGKIALRHLKTPLFDDNAHRMAHNTYSKNFGFSDIPRDMMNRLNVIKQETNVTVKQENLASSAVTAAVGGSDPVVVKQESTLSLSIKQEPSQSSGIIKQEPSSQSSGISPRKRKKMLNL